ncbi:Putative glutamate--cysteine ligase 2 [bacterium HR39]|nr:Putative glutamate--cysteine ligase 2 [bacterium HR39]
MRHARPPPRGGSGPAPRSHHQLVHFLPQLLAPSTSPPVWEGAPTGLKAFRPAIFGDLPRPGIPERLESHRDRDGLLEVLARTGLCDDPTKMSWDIRPSARQPTLEMRACDVRTRLDDALTIFALYAGIVRLLLDLRRNDQSWRLHRRLFIEENGWRAQRWGVEAELADFGALRLKPMAVLIEELLELVVPHLEETERPHAERARAIVVRGTSADRQIAIYHIAICHEALDRRADDLEGRRGMARWLMREAPKGWSEPSRRRAVRPRRLDRRSGTALWGRPHARLVRETVGRCYHRLMHHYPLRPVPGSGPSPGA